MIRFPFVLEQIKTLVSVAPPALRTTHDRVAMKTILRSTAAFALLGAATAAGTYPTSEVACDLFEASIQCEMYQNKAECEADSNCEFERGWAEWEGGREMHGVRESWDQQPPAVLQKTCACKPPTSQPGSSLHFCRGTCRVVYKDGVVWARRHASTAKMCAASEARRH